MTAPLSYSDVLMIGGREVPVACNIHYEPVNTIDVRTTLGVYRFETTFRLPRSRRTNRFWRALRLDSATAARRLNDRHDRWMLFALGLAVIVHVGRRRQLVLVDARREAIRAAVARTMQTEVDRVASEMGMPAPTVNFRRGPAPAR